MRIRARSDAWRGMDTIRRSLARLCAGTLVLLGVLSAAPAVAASGPGATGTATGQASPTAPPPAGGLLSSGTPTATSSVTPTTDPTPGAANGGVASSLQLPGTTPTVAAATTTATPLPPSPTPRPPDPTATRPANSPTPSPDPTATAAATPTGTPTVTPQAVDDLVHFVILENPDGGGNTAIARAAARHFGEEFRPDGVSWVGWCEMFAGNVLSESGIARPRYETALADAVSAPLYRGHAPVGSLVFFDQRANPNGHVGIALGDGTMLSALAGGIVRSAYESWPSYVGWRPYGATAPQDAPFVLAPLLTPTPPADDQTIRLTEMPPWPEQRAWYAPPPYIAPQTPLK